jgi:hypothetical protein
MSERPVQNIVLSFPKSGRTWLRVMLDSLGISFKYTHGGSSHRRGLHLRALAFKCPKTFDGKLIFMHRDPRDTVVSGFFQFTKRMAGGNLPISHFIRDPRHGIEKIVHFNLGWLRSLQGQSNVHVLSYEELSAHTLQEVTAVLCFMGKTKMPHLERVIEECRFDNMQKLERDGVFSARYGQYLTPRNPSDPNTFKVRRGVVGGYIDYLGDDDIAWCNAVLERFDYEASVNRLHSALRLTLRKINKADEA